jgi:hypothetical protein
MKIHALAIFVLAWCLVGCSPASAKKDSAPPMFRMSVTPNDALARFDLVLESEDTRPLCLTAEDWPNSFGRLGGWAGQAKVAVHDTELPSKWTNFGYCPINCTAWTVTREQPLHGFIAYDQFVSSEPLATVVDKRLSFKVRPYICREASRFWREQLKKIQDSSSSRRSSTAL